MDYASSIEGDVERSRTGQTHVRKPLLHTVSPQNSLSLSLSKALIANPPAPSNARKNSLMAIFRSLKTLISQSRRKLSNPAPSRTFFSLSLSSASPISSPYSLPSNGYIRRHILFRSRFLSPVGGPLFLFNPPWKLSQSSTPLLLQSDIVLNFLKLRAINLLHQPAFRYKLEHSAPRLLNESVREEFRNGAEIEASGVDNAIRDSFLNLPNFISFSRMLSGPLLGW